ncbi:phage repressor protein C with HTH and peptisase S24 domain [Rhodoblastus acidophilus]|uniref:S24 family peptidase n=1 Tax=Rhodoblastus acidophilus TaxID=1074 RepID=UPI0022259590|nr:S24 family peptidase [Rhodoblastus acidophilus]MCW2317981.1 phage repressor protein C with HTH and peptisase S24 domain [Rhodoblastus acidophilus]
MEARLLDDQLCEISERAFNIMADILRTPEQRRRVSELTNIPAMTLKDYFNGRTSPPLDRFIAIALAGQVPPAEFFASQTRPTIDVTAPPEVVVPYLDVEAAAGDGKAVDVVSAEASFPFPWPFLERLMGDAAYQARLETVRAHGSSMSPTIEDGALLMIDRAQAVLPSLPPPGRKITPGIYVFLQAGELRLKRLQRIAGDFIAIHSDNRDAYPPEVFSLKRDGSLKIIGKVVWWDNRL